MQTLANTEYQDLYRVTDGVLLVVNKFKPIHIDGVSYPRVYYTDRHNSKTYHKGCQKELKIMTKDYEHRYSPEYVIPTGTVVYSNMPVEPAPQNEWQYQIKTTGDLFSGNAEDMDQMISGILYLIRQGNTR